MAGLEEAERREREGEGESSGLTGWRESSGILSAPFWQSLLSLCAVHDSRCSLFVLIEKERERERGGGGETEKVRESERVHESERDREKVRESERDRERVRESERDRERSEGLSSDGAFAPLALPPPLVCCALHDRIAVTRMLVARRREGGKEEREGAHAWRNLSNTHLT